MCLFSSFLRNFGTKLLNHTVMKKILFLAVALLSIVSAKLYSSNQELVFEEPTIRNGYVVFSSDVGCVYKNGDKDCSVGNYNGCAAIYGDGKCNSDPLE